MTNFPGCFGSPLCFSDVSLPCTICPHQAECGPAADDCSRSLRVKHGIDDAIVAANRALNRRKPVLKPLKSDAAVKPAASAAVVHLTTPITSVLPVKAQDLKRRLDNKGINLRRAISRGVNPFVTQPPAFMRCLTSMVLDGGFSRREASQRLQSELGWSASAADSHATFATALMVAEGVITFDGQVYRRSAAA